MVKDITMNMNSNSLKIVKRDLEEQKEINRERKIKRKQNQKEKQGDIEKEKKGEDGDN